MFSSTEDLAEAVIKEMNSIRTDVVKWGLDPVGIDRVLYVVQLYDGSCAKLLAESMAGEDRRAGLLVLLTELRGIKPAIELGFKQAREADCMALHAINTESMLALQTHKAAPAFLS